MPQQEPALLTSWKEVAAYLGKGVRTVQRWEVRLGMPVRRPDDSKSGIIQVSREELDHWLESRWSPRANNVHLHENGSRLRNVGTIDLAKARDLRTKHHSLVTELQRSLSEFTTRCEQLGCLIGRAHSDGDRASSAPQEQRRAA